MHKLEFDQVQRQTRQTVGKFDFERIVGKHALLCLSILGTTKKNENFENGVDWAGVRREWEDAILLSVLAPAEGDAQPTNFTFEKAVRKVIGKFFSDCISIIKNTAQQKDPDNAKQVQLYSSLTCSTRRRSIVEIQKLLNDYKDALRLVAQYHAAATAERDEQYYIYAVSFLYAANRLGYFLDMEMN